MTTRDDAFQTFMEEVWYSPFIGTFETRSIDTTDVFDALTTSARFDEMLSALGYTNDEIEVNDWTDKAYDFDRAKARYAFTS